MYIKTSSSFDSRHLTSTKQQHDIGVRLCLILFEVRTRIKYLEELNIVEKIVAIDVDARPNSLKLTLGQFRTKSVHNSIEAQLIYTLTRLTKFFTAEQLKNLENRFVTPVQETLCSLV